MPLVAARTRRETELTHRCTFAFARCQAALVGAVTIPPPLAQDQSNQQQLQREVKALQWSEEQAEKFQGRVQPLAHRFAEAKLTHWYSDSVV